MWARLGSKGVVEEEGTATEEEGDGSFPTSKRVLGCGETVVGLGASRLDPEVQGHIAVVIYPNVSCKRR